MNNKLLSIKHGKGTKKKHTDKFFSYFFRHFRYIIGQQWYIYIVTLARWSYNKKGGNRGYGAALRK